MLEFRSGFVLTFIQCHTNVIERDHKYRSRLCQALILLAVYLPYFGMSLQILDNPSSQRPTSSNALVFLGFNVGPRFVYLR
jgi:hypothetical protein